jgi:23S rRNA (cytidine1920-2'-O)/16S rRNA (cytidine1409-2'-O)-methyltransferase
VVSSSGKRERADLLMVQQGLTTSREKARAHLLAGEVWTGGQRVDKPGKLLPVGTSIELRSRLPPFASRAGEKLSGALETLGLELGGKRILDVGASTGGFTDCLLQRGAAAVVAVDVGRGQLDARLRADPRVELREGVNARYLRAEQFSDRFDLITVDVSFISLAKILPALAPLLAPGGRLLVLVKPQFELGRGRVGPGGVVTQPQRRLEAVQNVAAAARVLGLEVLAALPSPLPGRDGNREAFLLLAPQAGLKSQALELALRHAAAATQPANQSQQSSSTPE